MMPYMKHVTQTVCAVFVSSSVLTRTSVLCSFLPGSFCFSSCLRCSWSAVIKLWAMGNIFGFKLKRFLLLQIRTRLIQASLNGSVPSLCPHIGHKCLCPHLQPFTDIIAFLPGFALKYLSRNILFLTLLPVTLLQSDSYLVTLQTRLYLLMFLLSKDGVASANSVIPQGRVDALHARLRRRKNWAEQGRRENDVVGPQTDSVERERCYGFHLLVKGQGINQVGWGLRALFNLVDYAPHRRFRCRLKHTALPKAGFNVVR